MMHAFDKNGDGTLDAAELLPALQELGLTVNARQGARILKQWDSDGNGMIDLVEFGTLVRSLQVAWEHQVVVCSWR